LLPLFFLGDYQVKSYFSVFVVCLFSVALVGCGGPPADVKPVVPVVNPESAKTDKNKTAARSRGRGNGGESLLGEKISRGSNGANRGGN